MVGLTKIQIIDETVKYYKTHKRGLRKDGSCVYFYNNTKCAVGRCMIDPKGFKDSNTIVQEITDLNSHLKPEYRGHSISFWDDLQELHDSPNYWVEGQLSELGLQIIIELKEKYSNNTLL